MIAMIDTKAETKKKTAEAVKLDKTKSRLTARLGVLKAKIEAKVTELGIKIDIRLVYNLRHAYFDIVKRDKGTGSRHIRGSNSETRTVHKYILDELARNTDRRKIRDTVKERFGRVISGEYISEVLYTTRCKKAQADLSAATVPADVSGVQIKQMKRIPKLRRKPDKAGYAKVKRFVLARTKARDSRHEIIKAVADQFEKSISIEMIKAMRRESGVYAMQPIDSLVSIDRGGKIRQLIVDEAERGTKVSAICRIIKDTTGNIVSPLKVTGFIYRQNQLKDNMVNKA